MQFKSVITVITYVKKYVDVVFAKKKTTKKHMQNDRGNKNQILNKTDFVQPVFKPRHLVQSLCEHWWSNI